KAFPLHHYISVERTLSSDHLKKTLSLTDNSYRLTQLLTIFKPPRHTQFLHNDFRKVSSSSLPCCRQDCKDSDKRCPGIVYRARRFGNRVYTPRRQCRGMFKGIKAHW